MASLTALTNSLLLELLDYCVEIRIAGAEASGKPVAAAVGDGFAVGDYIELAGLAGRQDGFHAEALLD